jgi:hypothetical protein
MVSSGKRK